MGVEYSEVRNMSDTLNTELSLKPYSIGEGVEPTNLHMHFIQI